MLKRSVILLSLLFIFACDDDDTGATTPCPQSTQSSETTPSATDTGKCDCPQTTDTNPQETETPTTDQDTLNGLLSQSAYDALLGTGLFVEEAAIFTTTYNEGYNLNFEISKEEAESLLPDNITPVALKLLESDDAPAYYLTWYLAVLDMESMVLPMTRIDLFTYGTNQNGDLTLYFLSSYMGLDKEIMDNEFTFGMIEEIFNFFARDSQNPGTPSYPHYYTENLTADAETFQLSYEDSSIELSKCDSPTTGERFSRDFIVVNSQIYRNPTDKNVNYFNQSFMNTNVDTRDVNCIKHENLTGFHPNLHTLKSIHFYGAKDKDITWYYEECIKEVCGSPFK